MHYIYIFWIAGKGIIRPKSLQKRIMSEDLRSVYSRAPEIFQRLRKEIDKVIVGQDRAIEQLLVSIIAGGHALLESNPGLAKTLLVKTTASCMGLDFSRIQCTPDLMPADITGTTIIDEIGGGKKFRFEPGPVFSNIVLADEINRASPKTQSALLEAMQEKQVTVGNKTYALDRPFFILATQNPIEMEGTFPLPEAQLDRFLLKIFMEYPTMDEELEILERYTIRAEPKVSPQVSKEEVIALQKLCRDIPIADDLKRAVVNLVLATRNWDGVQYGASPRASIMQFMVFAVNIPEQDPHPGQALSSTSLSSSSEILPAAFIPTPSKTLLRSRTLPFIVPAIIGPPEMTTDGRFSFAAAIAMPGTILSQFVTRTSPSNACPFAIISIESMISSRLGRENFIPSWFIAMPSQTPITGNSIGSPPAAYIPAFTASVMVLRWTCPGIIAL